MSIALLRLSGLVAATLVGLFGCGGIVQSEQVASRSADDAGTTVPVVGAADTGVTSPTPEDAPVPPAEVLTPQEVPDLEACASLAGDELHDFEWACAIDAEGKVYAVFPSIVTVPRNTVWIVQKFRAGFKSSSVPSTFVNAGASANFRVYQAPGKITDNLPLPEHAEGNRIAARGLRMDDVVVTKIDGTLVPGDQLVVFMSTTNKPAKESRMGYIWSRLYIAQ